MMPSRHPTSRIYLELFLVALGTFLFDQLTKWLIVRWLDYGQEYILLEGFFKFVHWGNTGAAWSMFQGKNSTLAIISLIAVIGLFLARHQFQIHRFQGRLALGLLYGGILGNFLDRILPSRQHVIDFLYFHLIRRGGSEIGFPAFNVADSAICIGVGLLFILSFNQPIHPLPEPNDTTTHPAPPTS